MLKLEDIKKGAQVVGLIPDGVVTIFAVDPVGEDALSVAYKLADGNIREQMVYRDREASLSLAKAGHAWAFDSPSRDFKLALEALRIEMGFAFDPMMAVHTSRIEPLPHQLSAVYESMLPRQPLRFVLADDPGAGKTIMAGLLIKELLIRADSQRILIVAPGSLTEQWQDEMKDRFTLEFKIFSREMQENSSSGNSFADEDLLIARLDQLARSEELQQKLSATQWDLVIFDEAHKLSAHYFGGKLEKTQRYHLGELLGSRSRHLLLMTATPHNGKDADFQVWLSLLDADRFYGDSRESPSLDVSDVMRRMVKEELLKFDGTRLFPERMAYTLNYKLSDAEAALYAHVTQYVCEEMNRADNLDGQRKHQVGFALTMLQRRLASSPEAIYQSLRRRRERLEKQLREMKLVARGKQVAGQRSDSGDIDTIQVERKLDLPLEWDDLEDELTPEEYEEVVDKVIDRSTAAETAVELEKEIQSLRELEAEAREIVASGVDCKWQRLSEILQDCPEMHDSTGAMLKLIVFTEHRDTLNYLQGKIAGLLGNNEAIRTIHGGTNRDTRKRIQEDFRNIPEVVVLIATDAAGEGVNLQKSHLMVNYDLPWNPNRLEQRFGRIHRICQTETCHLWNMVAAETREGDVFQTLFAKLEHERQALGGRVFDILGEVFEGTELKELIVEAIRHGQTPEARKWMTEKVASALDTERLMEIIRRNTLVDQAMTPEMLYEIRDQMDMAEARKLQPCFVRSFFKAAFESFGGELRAKEHGRFEIPNVPSVIRENSRVVALNRTPIARKYSRICFEKSQIKPTPSAEEATLVHPGHPLMHSLLNYVLLEKRQLLKPGAVMLDPSNMGTTPSLLFMIDHSVCEGEAGKTVSRRMQFVRLLPDGTAQNAGWAPHLDLTEPSEKVLELADTIRAQAWLNADLEAIAIRYASANLAKEHYDEVSRRRIDQVEKIHQAVRERLVKAINYWSRRALELEQDVAAGKQPRVQPANARQTAETLTARLQSRERELAQMRHIVSRTPVVLGGILVIPQGLVNQVSGIGEFCADAEVRNHVELVAMKAVMDVERSFGNTVEDVSALKCGWDVTSRYPVVPGEPLRDARHIEVKGRAKGATTVTLTRNEICYALNQRDKFILAIVLVDGDSYEGPYYIKTPFDHEPDLDDVSINKDIAKLIQKSVRPEQTL
jgi:SNF2 family DNA or RNA helicase